MEHFSYIVTPQAKKEIENITQIRNKILLQLIKPQDEIMIRWKALINRLINSARLRGKNFKHEEAEKVFLRGKKPEGELEHELTDYYKDIVYIKYTWLLNNNVVTLSDIIKLKTIKLNSRKEEDEMLKVLKFVQINFDDPIVQAVLAFTFLNTIKGYSNIANHILILHIFLYKYGFDFRGLLDIEEYILNDKEHFQKLVEEAKKEKSLTKLLEYVIQAISIQSEKAYYNLTTKQFKNVVPPVYFNLTDRQKQILYFFEKPEARITNRNVQSLFKVSQITASRDLAKLASLGLIIAFGKGRSTYYSKV